MNALVVGGGSIGSRHLRNLRHLGIDKVALVEPDTAGRDAIAAELPIFKFSRLQEGLDWAPHFVVVATPTHLHVEQTAEVVRAGIPVFVEKPLSHNATGIAELANLVRDTGLISMVGCNMRFHPGPARVKQLLTDGAVGKILFARIHVGSYLPEWRPNADYRQNYAARAETGGGCILDCIHEIDLAQWYLGKIEAVFCWAGHLSSLEIQTEDIAALICRHAGGTMSEIHLDYVQRTYERGCQIVGEQGSVFWDFDAKAVRWYSAQSKQWSTYPEPESWKVNQMYVDEMMHFLESVEKKCPTALPIPEAAELMQVVFAAKTSSQSGTTVAVAERVP